MKIGDKTYKIFDRSWDAKNPWAELPFDRILEKCSERDDVGQLEQLSYKINFIFKIFAANPDLIPDEIKEEMLETLQNSCRNGYQDDYKVIEQYNGLDNPFEIHHFSIFAAKKIEKIEKTFEFEKFCSEILTDAPYEWETPEEYFTRLFF